MPYRIVASGPGARLALILLVLLSSQATAETLESVSWQNLEQHLDGDVLSAPTLGVSDCPGNSELPRASRRGLQWIEGTFYRWDEHDLADGNTCLQMIDPEPRQLSQSEARVLLTASGRWQDQLVGVTQEVLRLRPETRPIEEFVHPPFLSTAGAEGLVELSRVGYSTRGEPTDEALDELLRGPLPHRSIDDFSTQVLPSVIGSDQRQIVADSRVVPYRHIAFVDAETTFFNPNTQSFGPGIGRATGFLISPHAVLTNAHVVWDEVQQRFVEDARVIPGVFVDSAGPTAPFGVRSVSRYAVSSAYTKTEQVQFDYGAMFFDNPFQGINTTMPIFINVVPTPGSTVEIAGYPGSVRSQPTHAQYTHTGNVSAVQGRVLRYTVDTSSGNSGSPIMIVRNGQHRAIGLHSSGEAAPATSNSGARFTSDNEALLLEWLRWEPQDRAGFDLSILSEVTDRCPSLELLVSVVDSQGDPVADLSTSHFTLFENGAERDIVVAPGELDDTERNIALLLDGSSSLSQADIDAEKQAARTFVAGLQSSDRLAIYIFNSTVSRVLDFSTNRGAALAAIDTLRASGSTALYAAIAEAALTLDGLEGRKAIVLMTDGSNSVPNFSIDDAIQAAQIAEAPVYSAGFGNANDGVLDRISRETKGQYFRSPSAADLERILKLISEQINNFYIITWLTEFADPSLLDLEVIVRDGDDSDRETTSFRLIDTPCQPIQGGCNVTVESPNGNEVWLKDEPQTIRWRTQGGNCRNEVSIALFDGTELRYLPNTANDGEQVIDIRSMPATSQYRAVVTELATGRSDKSDQRFSVVSPFAPFPCQSDSRTLCLAGDRFMVQAIHRVQGNAEYATAVRLTPDTGYFWFFDPANVELVGKVLDARFINGFFWFFYGALSDVEYTLYVTDTQTGATKAYFNPQGVQASRADVQFFAPVIPEGQLPITTSELRPSSEPALAEATRRIPSADRSAFSDPLVTPIALAPTPPEHSGDAVNRPELHLPELRGSELSWPMRNGTAPDRDATTSVGAASIVGEAFAQTVLHDQLNNGRSQGVSSQFFVNGSSQFHTQAADDFEVPPGATWEVDLVEVRGFFSASGQAAAGPASSIDVRFYNNAFNTPGTIRCQYTDLQPAGLADPNFRVPLPSRCTLPAGRYWVEVQSNQILDTHGQWFWRTRSGTFGIPAQFQNPGGFFGCPTWDLLGNCLDSLGFWDLAFKLEGSADGSGVCTASATNLCLNEGRFRVNVAWAAGSDSGVGIAELVTSDTGYFWFFNAANIELMIKVLDARVINNKFWVFYGALSDVEYTITIEDTVTGNTKTYTNIAGQLASVGDVEALPGN